MALPNFKYEEMLWKRGFECIAGMDEVGRGCFAGPIVASACAFAPCTALTLRRELRLRSQGASVRGKPVVRIDDSKKLTEKQRLVAAKWIEENCLAWGVGQASVAEINKKGLTRATASAFRRAVKGVQQRTTNRVDHLLIDAFFVPYIRDFPSGSKMIKKLTTRRVADLGNRKIKKLNGYARLRQLAIVDGDAKSFSIAAASIIAKVYRDALMEELSKNKNYKKYGWDKNKGYGTKMHQGAILKYGITRHHRKKFVETFLSRKHVLET